VATGYREPMPKYELNDAAVRHARKLIDAGSSDESSDWSEAAPSTDDGNRVIEEKGWDAFAAWHLAVDPEANEETKKRYAVQEARPAAGPRRERARGGGQRGLLLLQRLDGKRGG
jgi:hypothetical protein